MQYWVYIMQSQSTDRYYCGYSDNVERRVSQHNDPGYRGLEQQKLFKDRGISYGRKNVLVEVKLSYLKER